MIYEKNFKKTKKIIINAMFELLEEKHFDKITINDIVTKVDINRSTFYRNFLDKYDLIDIMENTFISEFLKIRLDIIDILLSTNINVKDIDNTKAVNFLEENQYYLKIFFSNNYPETFKNKLLKHSSIEIKKIINNISHNKEELEINFIVNYISFFIIGAIDFYIKNPSENIKNLINFILEQNQKMIFSMIIA